MREILREDLFHSKIEYFHLQPIIAIKNKIYEYFV